MLKDGLDMGPCSSVIKVARDASCVPFKIFYYKLYTMIPCTLAGRRQQHFGTSFKNKVGVYVCSIGAIKNE